MWTEAAKPLGPIAYILRACTVLLRDLGAALAPFNAFQILQGIETLPLRMPRHCENALKVVEYLTRRTGVTKVIHPSRQTGAQRQRADQIMKGGYGGLVGFELAGGHAAGRRFIEVSQAGFERMGEDERPPHPSRSPHHDDGGGGQQQPGDHIIRVQARGRIFLGQDNQREKGHPGEIHHPADEQQQHQQTAATEAI